VALDLHLDLFQMVGQLGGAQGTALRCCFDSASVVEQDGKIVAQGLVEAAENELDDGGGWLLLPRRRLIKR